MAITTIDLSKMSGTSLPSGISTGKVLQVVETRKTDTASTSSSTFSAISGLSASITPSSSSNKILVSFTICGSGGNHHHAAISRDSGSNFVGAGVAVGNRPATNAYFNVDANEARSNTAIILDSPSSTSELTYQVYWRSNSSTLYLNRTQNDVDFAYSARSASSVTLMEIAG